MVAGPAGAPGENRSIRFYQTWQAGAVALRSVDAQDAWVADPITVEAIYDLPDDHCRHELVGGVHYVSPGPGGPHQTFVGELFVALRAACPSHLRVNLSRNVRRGTEAHVEPDLLVLCRQGPDDRTWIDPADDLPLLVVETISPGPTNARKDRVDKPDLYESLGIPSYWLGDPAIPSLVALELVAGHYEERAGATGADVFRVERPFPVELSPADLLR